MKLHESADDITNVLKEEAESSGAAGSSAAINRSDFSVDTLEIPKAEEKKPEAPPAAAAPVVEVEKKTTTEEKTTIGPNGEKIVEKVVVVSQPSSEKSAAVARLFNSDTALLMFDIFLTRFGGIFTPDRPREYWALTTQDKGDLSTLLKESAKEEQWTGVPTKWLLLGALGLMIGGKVVYAKKLEYQFVPGEKPGDPKKKTEDKKENNSSEEKNDNDYKTLFTREKARWEVEQGFKNNSAEVEELKKQNTYLFNLIEKAKLNKTPGSGVQEVEFEDIPQKKIIHNADGDYIFKDSQGKEWNLDKVEFTENHARLDRTKAGLPGWANNGVKLGNISAGQHEAFAEWKRYRKSKKVAA